MSSTLTITREVSRITRLAPVAQIGEPQKGARSRLREAARVTRSLTALVEGHWEELPSQVKDVFRALAYSAIEPKPSHILPMLRHSWALASLAFYILTEGPTSVLEAVSEVRRLVEAILSAIEREHPAYEKAQANAVKAALSDADRTPSMTASEFGEWVKRVHR